MIRTDKAVVDFMSEKLGKEFSGPYSVMGFERDGEIIGGVLFNCFQRPDIHFTAAGRGWTRGFLEEVGRYVFGQLQCTRMTAVTEHDDVVRLGLRLGGEVEGRLRNHFGDGKDGVIVGILAKDYKYGKVGHI